MNAQQLLVIVRRYDFFAGVIQLKSPYSLNMHLACHCPYVFDICIYSPAYILFHNDAMTRAKHHCPQDMFAKSWLTQHPLTRNQTYLHASSLYISYCHRHRLTPNNPKALPDLLPIMPKHPNLYTFPSTDGLAPLLRKYVLSAQNAGIENHSTFRLAVSGGSLPKTLAKALLAKSNGSADDVVHFSKWDIFFADERAVSLDHEDSNYKLLNDELLSKIPSDMGKPQVHTIDTSLLDDVQELADTYEAQLVSTFAAKDSVKVPLFDLILLGCGPDGHTCSLFPGHELLRETVGWILPISDSPKPPAKRITLSLPVVHAATRIAFVATGEGKREVMEKIFDSEEGHQLPCGLVNEGGDKVSWFADEAAASGISSVPKRSSL